MKYLGIAILALAAAAQGPPELGERDFRIRRVGEGPRDAGAIPRGYALVIGVSKYQRLDPSDNLRFPETDAEAIYRVLISQQGGAFPPENVHLLLGSQATLGNIRRELEEWLPSAAQERDRVVVYFAGHGLVKHGRGYLAPFDVDPTAPETTAYPMDVLGKILGERVKARWKVLFTDACHSGKITPESSDEAVDATFRTLPNTFLTFTATREQERSFEDPTLSTGFGLFSYFVVQALQGQADNDPCDGIVTADELIEYVRAEVKQYARARGESQTPTDRGDFDNGMVLGVPGAGCGTARVAILLGSLTIESNMDDVSIYLDDKLVGTAHKGKPLTLPGLAAGLHTVRGVREGYEPSTREAIVVPGQQRSVSLLVQYRRQYKKSAVEFREHGERLLFKQRSGLGSLNAFAVYSPSRQTQKDFAEARDWFERALREDPSYAEAAYDLALACQMLSDSQPMLEAFRRAIQSNPNYLEARVNFAGALIEEGDPDEAIRQLVEAIRLEPAHDLAYSHLGRAYLDKQVFDKAIEASDHAIALRAGNEQALLWKADALRRRAVSLSGDQRKAAYSQAVESYREFVRRTNFSTAALEKVAYYAIGFGLGARKHADRQPAYVHQRKIGFMGLCECEHKLGNSLRAIKHCERAVEYDKNEAMAYFLLGNVYRDLFNRSNTRDYLLMAMGNYLQMIQINPDLDLSRNAKNYVEQISVILNRLRR